MPKHRRDTYRERRKRRSYCFHHDPRTGESFIESHLEDLGRKKVWVCTNCVRMWFS